MIIYHSFPYSHLQHNTFCSVVVSFHCCNLVPLLDYSVVTHVYTVWPEILAGRYFGGLLKICHLAEFTLAVEPVLAIMIFIAKWLKERAGNLTWP